MDTDRVISFEEKLMKEGSATLLLPDGKQHVTVEQGMVSWKKSKKTVSHMMMRHVFTRQYI